MDSMEKQSGSFTAWEYQEVTAEGGNLSMLLDGYTGFGWKQDENQDRIRDRGQSAIRLKRDRNIRNKAELTRLQRHFEDCIRQIAELEKAKTSLATAVSIAVGAIGTVFMAGSVFAVTHEPPVIWLCVILAIPGFAGWILPRFLYRYVVRKKTQIMGPLIEDKLDEMYVICEKGSRLLS